MRQHALTLHIKETAPVHDLLNKLKKHAAMHGAKHQTTIMPAEAFLRQLSKNPLHCEVLTRGLTSKFRKIEDLVTAAIFNRM